MTRTVFDNAMTAHVWAAQTQPRGESHNGNLWFEGRSIYSYGTHYCAGYVAPGGVYLWNADSSTVTTNGKHLPAVRRAIPGPGYGVPGLTELARALEYARRYREGRAAVRYVAAAMEKDGRDTWPGIDTAAAIFRGLGASEAESARRAQAIDSRVAKAHAKAQTAATAQERAAQLKEALRLADRNPADSADWARKELSAAVGRGMWPMQRARDTVTVEAREAFRAAKAAKARGWPRVAGAARAHYLAIRGELARLEHDEARYLARSQTRDRIKAIRGAAEQIATFEAFHETAATSEDSGALLRSCETGAGGFAQLAAAIVALAASPFAGAVWGPDTVAKARAAAQEARARADSLKAQAVQARQDLQARARAEWLATGARPDYRVGQLCDSEGGALIRAANVKRDDSGAIVGGELVTSWGASVPLAHAIRAFRFLKLCRERGQGWAANGHTIRVGHFRVDSVDSSGNFKAGCHAINWQEAARLAAELGLAELAADSEALESSRGAA